MALDLGKTILQLDRVAQNLGSAYSDRQSRLASLLQQAGLVTAQQAPRVPSNVPSWPRR